MVVTGPSRGIYADGRVYALPQDWAPLEPSVREQALDRTLHAFDGAAGTSASALSRVRRYYDPNGPYAGALLSTIEPNPHDEVTPADLLAVATLSMRVPALAARRLLDHRDEATRIIKRRLGEIPFGLPLTSLDSSDREVTAAKAAMRQLHDEVRTLLPTQSGSSNRWVLAAKLCARKRPYLFPVRDRKVCEFLASGRLRGVGMGQFDNDLQVFAYLMSHPQVSASLAQLRTTLEAEGVVLDVANLRLLDVVLWTASWATGEPEPHRPSDPAASPDGQTPLSDSEQP